MGVPDALVQCEAVADDIASVVRPPAAGGKWGQMRETLRTSPWREGAVVSASLDGGAERLFELEVALNELQDCFEFFLTPKWEADLRARMSGTYVSEFRKRQKAARTAADEFVAGARSELVDAGATSVSGKPGDAMADFIECAQRVVPSFSELAAAVYRRSALAGKAESPAARAAMRRYVLRPAGGSKPSSSGAPPDEASPEEAASVLSWLPLGRTTVGEACEPCAPGVPPAMDASLPHSRAYVYDFGRFLRGIPGGANSGLNYRVVQALESIREIGPDSCRAASPAKEGAGARLDAPGVCRALRGDQKVSAQVRRDLANYNGLAQDALFGTVGVQVANPEELLERFAEETEETPVIEREVQVLEAALDVPRERESGGASSDRDGGASSNLAEAARAASSIMLLRNENAMRETSSTLYAAASLPGALESRERETAMSSLVQAAALQDVVARMRARHASGARVAPMVLQRVLAAHGPDSLKLFALLHARHA